MKDSSCRACSGIRVPPSGGENNKNPDPRTGAGMTIIFKNCNLSAEN